ncbi:hypothetical protein [Gordonibacter sp. An230]|uniref:hypothetical protein n=1 Tax=Gordonibacter sp. An230 TaxID=1965592 RepID=UPI00194DE341|nr:hypothetical protein [Gordonibacter sp. An230]
MNGDAGQRSLRSVLLTEGSSLTARETLTVLGSYNLQVDVLVSQRAPMAAFSGMRRRIVQAPRPGDDPLGYLGFLDRLVAEESYDAVLPTHEQAWLLAEASSLLSPGFPAALASAKAFRQLQGKVGFARLLDKLGIPQPPWVPLGEPSSCEPPFPFPFWVKASYGTAGRSVRKVHDRHGLERALADLSGAQSGGLMAQSDAEGQYGQVQALFDHGRMVAVHTSVATGTGAGPSAAARMSVDFPAAREHARVLGAHLGWHGPFTLDFLHTDGNPRYLECNPRMIEPGNAWKAGVNLPLLLAKLSAGCDLGTKLRIGAAGARTCSLQALLLGAAESRGTRRAVLDALLRRGRPHDETEVLTPVQDDPPSAIPLAAVAVRLLANPASVSAIARKAIDAYSVGPAAIAELKAYAPPIA